jgi:hypothetical protein
LDRRFLKAKGSEVLRDEYWGHLKVQEKAKVEHWGHSKVREKGFQKGGGLEAKKAAN